MSKEVFQYSSENIRWYNKFLTLVSIPYDIVEIQKYFEQYIDVLEWILDVSENKKYYTYACSQCNEISDKLLIVDKKNMRTICQNCTWTKLHIFSDLLKYINIYIYIN